MTLPDTNPEATSESDLWFLGPKLQRVPVEQPEDDEMGSAFEGFAGGAMGVPDVAPPASERADEVEAPTPTRSQSEVPNKFAKVLPPMPELPLDPSTEEMLSAQYDGKGGGIDALSVYALIGAVLAVLTMVAVALILHPWAHTVVVHH